MGCSSRRPDWRRKFPTTEMLPLGVYTRTSSGRTGRCRLPLRILESTRIRPFPSIGPSTDATLRSMTAKFSPGCISPCGVLLFGVLIETVSSLPGLCDERSYCSLTGPHTGSDPDGSEGEMSRYADGYTMRAVTSRRPMQTGVFGKALSSVVCCAEGYCGC
jgi:hypothetical protein